MVQSLSTRWSCRGASLRSINDVLRVGGTVCLSLSSSLCIPPPPPSFAGTSEPPGGGGGQGKLKTPWWKSEKEDNTDMLVSFFIFVVVGKPRPCVVNRRLPTGEET